MELDLFLHSTDYQVILTEDVVEEDGKGLLLVLFHEIVQGLELSRSFRVSFIDLQSLDPIRLQALIVILVLR